MSQIERYTTAETSIDQYRQSIGLKLDKIIEVSFTKTEITYASTESGIEVVVKKPLQKDQALHEWKGLNLAYSTGISVPTPLALVHYDENHLAIVSSMVKGNNLYYFPDTAIKNEIGRQIKIMHHLGNVEGKMWKTSGRSSFTYYDMHMFSWARESIKELGVNSKTRLLLDALSQHMEQFCKDSKPVLNHNDLHDGQIIVAENNSATIIDFGNWTEETWLNDVGYYLFHLIRTDRARDDFLVFLNGYMDNKKLSDSEKSNLIFYLLFISSRALSHFNKIRSSYLAIARETHSKVLTYVDNEELWKAY